MILATDLSPAWDDIVACGAELKPLGCRVAVLTYVAQEPLTQKQAVRLAAQQRQLAALGLEVVVETVHGPPAASLNRLADQHDASLIIVGSHGKSLWREGVLGSFSSAVLHNLQHPLLVLPVRLTGGEDRPSCVWKCTELLRHLLLPTDFSETAAEALCYLELLAPKGVQRVTLVHALSAAAEAQPERGLTDPGVLNARNFLEVLQARVQAAGAAQVDLCLAAGHPVAVIRGILASRGISLVVMGTQGKGYIQELFLGSVAHNVTRLAPCPVLLIPRIERNPGA